MTGEVPAAGRGRRSTTVRVLRVVVGLAFVAALGWVLADQWRDIRPLLGQISPAATVGAGIAVLAGIFATFLCWRELLAGLGYRPPVSGAMRIFFVGQLGKYLPGSVWPVMAQMELGRDYRVPPRASGAAVMVFVVVVIGTGLMIAVPTLPLLAGAFDRYWWTVLVLPVALVSAVPAVLNRLIGAVLRLARRDPMPAPLGAAAIGRAAAWSMVAWAAYGLHLWLLAGSLGVVSGPGSLLVLTGAFAAAWTIGFLVVIAPAGAGAREATLILLLVGLFPTPQATLLALLSRLLFTLGDLVWCAPALVLHRRRWRAVDA